MSTAERILDLREDGALLEGVLEGDASTDEPLSADAPETPRAPLVRELTAEVRKKIGLPAIRVSPFNWPIAIAMVVLLGIPLALMGKYILAVLATFVGLVIFPLIRALEAREIRRRETLFLTGRETVARVLEVEPAGGGRRDHLIRIEYFAEKQKVEASIVGAPIARRGLSPGEDVVIVFDVASPQKCIVVDRVLRNRPARRMPRMEPDPAAHACGCGKGDGSCR